jgi:hypothetical protein
LIAKFREDEASQQALVSCPRGWPAIETGLLYLAGPFAEQHSPEGRVDPVTPRLVALPLEQPTLGVYLAAE